MCTDEKPFMRTCRYFVKLECWNSGKMGFEKEVERLIAKFILAQKLENG
jgi:hypothetical protein